MDVFELLIGIIVFIIWIFSSVAGTKHKKKTLPRPPLKSDVPSPQQPSHPGGLLGELKRTIQTVMEELQEQQLPDVVTPETFSGESLHDYEQTITGAVPGEEKSEYGDTLMPVALKPKSPEITSHFYTNTEKQIHLGKQLREMVIWSEILAPPVALRDK